MKDLSNKNVVHVIKDGIQYLQFKKLLEYNDVISHAYSLDTSMNFRTAKANKESLPQEEFDKGIESYKKVCNSLEINYKNVVKTNQEHTDNVQIIDKKINK